MSIVKGCPNSSFLYLLMCLVILGTGVNVCAQLQDTEELEDLFDTSYQIGGDYGWMQ